MQEPGRYHVAWKWKGREKKGHIVTAERLTSGRLRWYDPQTGKVGLPDFGNIGGNVRVLRVDGLRANPSIVKDVLAKSGTGNIEGMRASFATILTETVGKKSFKGFVSELEVTGRNKQELIKIAKLRSKAWVSALPKVQGPNGFLVPQVKVGEFTIYGSRYMKETLSKCLYKKDILTIMEYATKASEWLPTAKLVRIEQGKHHSYAFKVYQAVYNGQKIEVLVKDLPDNPVYMMRFI